MSGILVKSAKFARARLETLYYHQRHRREAAVELGALERNGYILAPQARRRCDEYAAEVLGWRGYAPWLYVYAAAQGGFVEGWIPDNYYGSVVLPVINGVYGENLSKMRFINGTLFPTELPTLDVVGVVNGQYLDPGAAPLSRDEAFARLVQQPGGVIFKTDFSNASRGLTVIRSDEVGGVDLTRFNNGIFQRLVRQAAGFEEIVRGPVATLRLTTVRDNQGEITLRSAYLRFGRLGDTSVRPDSEVIVLVDRAEGTFAGEGYMPDWRRVPAHPDTGVRFDGRAVPGYDACLKFVRDCHRRVSYVQCVGWDVTVDAEGRPCLLEWNGGHNDIKFSEATQGPCFDDLGWQTIWRREHA